MTTIETMKKSKTNVIKYKTNEGPNKREVLKNNFIGKNNGWNRRE